MSRPTFLLGRRRFVIGTLTAAVAAPILQACAQAPPTPSPAPAPKPAAPAPAAPVSQPTPAPAPAAKPTAAPAAAAPAKPTAAPAAAAPAASTGGPSAGSLPYKVNSNAKGEITIWHWWGSSLRRNAIRRVVGQFHEQYPNIKVTETFVPWGEIWTKNVAAVAAGKGMPDVCMETQNLRDRVAKNIVQPLGDLAKRDSVTGKEFWGFTWDEGAINGVPYGLPFETNVSVYFYNKNIFADAGVDPEKAPKDWNDLWEVAEKIDKKTNGKLERLGFHPLIGRGLDTWALNNGGEWQDKEHNPTLNRQENVEALEWIKKYSDRHGKSAVDALQGTFGPQGPQDRFMSGKMASLIEGQSYVSFLNLFNADGLPAFQTQDKKRLSWGIAPIIPAPGKKPASFSGSFKITIPRGVTKLDPAWEFIKYQAFVGQASWARDTYHIPTVKDMAIKDTVLNADPRWGVFIQWMEYGREGVYNPYFPNMLSLLGPATDAALAGKMTPKEALDDAQKKAEAEIAKNKK